MLAPYLLIGLGVALVAVAQHLVKAHNRPGYWYTSFAFFFVGGISYTAGVLGVL